MALQDSPQASCPQTVVSCSVSISSLALNAVTCGDVMVDALHRDGGIGDGVALEVTHEALDAAVNLQTTHRRTERSKKDWGINLCEEKMTEFWILYCDCEKRSDC